MTLQLRLLTSVPLKLLDMLDKCLFIPIKRQCYLDVFNGIKSPKPATTWRSTAIPLLKRLASNTIPAGCTLFPWWTTTQPLSQQIQTGSRNSMLQSALRIKQNRINLLRPWNSIIMVILVNLYGQWPPVAPTLRSPVSNYPNQTPALMNITTMDSNMLSNISTKLDTTVFTLVHYPMSQPSWRTYPSHK